MASVLAIGRTVSQKAGELHDQSYSNDSRSDVRTPANARLSRDLLHLAHLLDAQKLAVMTEVHRLKGLNSPDLKI